MKARQSILSPRAVALAVALALAFAPIAVFGQQQGVTAYEYDKNGRLVSVITPAGEKIDYEYDLSGNVVTVRRTAAVLAVFSFSPREGGAGDLITFIGFGFGPNIADNTVSFNGALAKIVSSSPTQIVAVVPDNATIGPVTVTTPKGSVTTADFFMALPRLRVEPSSATLLSGQSKQFSTVFTAYSGDQSVLWSVNGKEGGDASVGTISKTGLYTAPILLTQMPQVKIRATSIAMASLIGEADVLLRERLQFAALSEPISVQRGLGINEAVAASSAAVSVRLGNGLNEPVSLVGSGVSVKLGSGLDTPLPIVSSIMSVRLGFGIDQAVPAFGSIVSVTNGPIVSSIVPGSLKQGASAQLTITGTNLSGARSINFIDANGAVDTSIVASNILINAEGTQLTATVASASTTALGRRAVVVSTPNASSQTANIGTNALEIIAP